MDYLLFFPVAAVLNFIIPRKYRYILLCMLSLVFYGLSDLRSMPVIMAECIFIYFAGIIVDKTNSSGRVILSHFMIVVFSLIPIAALIVFKYLVSSGYPLGMSFFSLQATGYLIDVYKKKTSPEKNPVRLILYICFFPIVSSGPIERTDNLLKQIREGSEADICRIKKGLLELAWGLYMKMVLSNRIAPMVDVIYEGYDHFRGIEIMIATVLFGIQIYCDFAGYSYMAIGSARILGYDLVDNFDAPYMSTSPGMFWRRWHMSLYNWFREYIYFPLGGSRRGKLRKYINVMIVFIVSGIWHGKKLGFIFWGALNGIFVVAQDLLIRGRTAGGKKTDNKGVMTEIKTALSVIGTFFLIDYAWMFFKADSFRQGLSMSRTLLTNFGISEVNLQTLLTEFEVQLFDCIVVIAGVVLLLTADFLKNKYKDVSKIIFTSPTAVRWIIYLSLLSVVIIFGIYGYSYEQTEFIYFQF